MPNLTLPDGTIKTFDQPDSFADVVRGLHVYGRKVIRPEGLVLGIVDYS